jgi:hypothetical protein
MVAGGRHTIEGLTCSHNGVDTIDHQGRKKERRKRFIGGHPTIVRQRPPPTAVGVDGAAERWRDNLGG